MPGARPRFPHGQPGGRRRGAAHPADRPRDALAPETVASEPLASEPLAPGALMAGLLTAGPGHPGWRMPARGPLLRRAAGLVVGLLILIPAAGALDGGDTPPTGHSHPGSRPPVVAASAERAER